MNLVFTDYTKNLIQLEKCNPYKTDTEEMVHRTSYFYISIN